MKRPLLLAAIFIALLLALATQLPKTSGGDLPQRCRLAAKDAQDAVKSRLQHQRNLAALAQYQAHLWPADSSPSSLQVRLRALAQQAGCLQVTLSANSEMKGGKDKIFDLINCSARGEAQLDSLLRFIALVEAQSPSIVFTSCRLNPVASKPGVWTFDAQVQAGKTAH